MLIRFYHWIIYVQLSHISHIGKFALHLCDFFFRKICIVSFIIKYQQYFRKIIFISYVIRCLFLADYKWQINIYFFFNPIMSIHVYNILVKHINIGAIYPDIIQINVYFRKTFKNKPKQFIFLMISFYNQQCLISFSLLHFVFTHISQTPH